MPVHHVDMLDDTFAHQDWYLANRMDVPSHFRKDTRDIITDFVRWAYVGAFVSWFLATCLIALAVFLIPS